jgi:hypothetical protein
MKKHTTLLWVSLALLTSAFTIHAQVPSLINYQGRLTDAQGNPVNGERTMVVRIYDAPTGGNLTYEENIGTVSVQDGKYSFRFGTGNGINSALNGEDFLALTVNGTEESNRSRLLAVPYALKSATSEDAQEISQTVADMGNTLGWLLARDYDGDGVNDYRELKDGTDPNDPSSFNNLSKGLIAYYPLNENTNDYSGYRRHGISSGVVYTSDRFESQKRAADFRNNGYIEIPDLRNMKNYPITYSMWTYLDTFHTSLSWRGWGEMFIIGKDQPGNTNSAVISIRTGPDYQTDIMRSNILSYSGYTSNYVPVLKQWIHISMTIDSSQEATFYINGIAVATWAATTQYNLEETDLPFRISTPYIFNQLARQSFQGFMDSVRIYNRALTSSEITQLYQADTNSNPQ